MKSVANPPTPWPNWQAPASTRKKLADDHHGARWRVSFSFLGAGGRFPKERFGQFGCVLLLFLRSSYEKFIITTAGPTNTTRRRKCPELFHTRQSPRRPCSNGVLVIAAGLCPNPIHSNALALFHSGSAAHSTHRAHAPHSRPWRATSWRAARGLSRACVGRRRASAGT